MTGSKRDLKEVRKVILVTIQTEAGDETKFCLSDEEVQILESEVDRVNRTIAEIEAEEGREMCRGTLETELINAIREHVKRLKEEEEKNGVVGKEIRAALRKMKCRHEVSYHITMK